MREQVMYPVEPRGMEAIVSFLLSFPWKEFTQGVARSIAADTRGSYVARFQVFTVRFYKKHFSRSRSVCIYNPSCSSYAMEAVQKYGAIKGTTLAMRRLLRCRPPYKGRYDPVP
jgi:putative membrane protein insertion efficiency factor